MKGFTGNEVATVHGQFGCKYHNTHVVLDLTHGRFELNSGGHQTVTTKRRINQWAAHYGYDFSVYQRDYRWYVEVNGRVYQYQDHMVIKPWRMYE